MVCALLFFPPLFGISLGFFSLNSIAYRRVIRVYQYEVGDDLSGRFFFLFFLSHCVLFVLFRSVFIFFKCALLIPKARFFF